MFFPPLRPPSLHLRLHAVPVLPHAQDLPRVVDDGHLNAAARAAHSVHVIVGVAVPAICARIRKTTQLLLTAAKTRTPMAHKFNNLRDRSRSIQGVQSCRRPRFHLFLTGYCFVCPIRLGQVGFRPNGQITLAAMVETTKSQSTKNSLQGDCPPCRPP